MADSGARELVRAKHAVPRNLWCNDSWSIIEADLDFSFSANEVVPAIKVAVSSGSCSYFRIDGRREAKAKS